MVDISVLERTYDLLGEKQSNTRGVENISVNNRRDLPRSFCSKASNVVCFFTLSAGKLWGKGCIKFLFFKIKERKIAVTRLTSPPSSSTES